MQPSQFFTKEEKDRITSAIREAELNTSGEIRVHIERRCKEDVLD
ncbi:MAG TPA: TPM domain-containing protein, partial [Bacteroides sp.]|nr:TPM domain-containing protein [Bacteroides sp.]